MITQPSGYAISQAHHSTILHQHYRMTCIQLIRSLGDHQVVHLPELEVLVFHRKLNS
jgi:hypothetical protein